MGRIDSNGPRKQRDANGFAVAPARLEILKREIVYNERLFHAIMLQLIKKWQILCCFWSFYTKISRGIECCLEDGSSDFG